VGVRFNSGEGLDAVLRGLTITHGETGILCFDSSPTIIGNVISDHVCYSYTYGGGITCHNSSAGIYGNTIINNQSTYFVNDYGPHHGGGIYCDSSTLTIVDNVISDNRARSQEDEDFGGGIYCLDSTVVMHNCLITGNSAYDGGGVYCQGSDVTLRNCTLMNGNRSIPLPGNSHLLLVNCISWDLPNGYLGQYGIAYSDVRRSTGPYPGPGNIDADPLFTSGDPAGSYCLSQIAGRRN